MHINSLPSEILVAILKPLSEEEHYHAGCWKGSINLLVICRKWRYITLPLVYNKIYISYVHSMTTNLDLITSDMKHYPRTVSIWVNICGNDLKYCLQGIMNKLEINKHKLSNINSLDVNVYTGGRLPDGDEPQEGIKETHYEIAERLKKLLPRISILNSVVNTPISTVIGFENALLKQYAPQLTSANLSSLALTSEIRFTDSLTKFRLCWYQKSLMLPRINTDFLTKLELNYVNESFDWSILSQKDTHGPGIIYLPALEYMSVNTILTYGGIYDSVVKLVGPKNKFSYILETPRLKILHIPFICAFTCSLLASISIDKRLEKLYIGTVGKPYFAFYGINLSITAKHVLETYYNSSKENDLLDDIDLLNDLQNIDGLVEYGTHVKIDYGLSGAEIQKIYWPNVTRLCIGSPISLTTILTLVIPKLPDLISLKVKHITLDTREDGTLVIPKSQGTSAISPIKCKLKSLTYGYGFPVRCDVPQSLDEAFKELMFGIIGSLEDITTINLVNIK